MREHLFRGFHPDKNGTTEITLNGEKIRGYWVEGNLFISDDKTECQILMGSKTIRIAYDTLSPTVCEYIGLADKNSKKIFEGDIISFSVFDYNGGDTQYKGVVKWSDTEQLATRFMIWHDNQNEYYGADGAFDFDWVHYQDSELEIIGNIYENAELLR